MTNYYIEKDNKIIFVDTDLNRLQMSVANGEYETLEIQQTTRPIVNFEFADTPEYIAEQKQKAEAHLFTEARECIEKLLTYKLLYPAQATTYQNAVEARYAQLDAELAQLDGE